MINGLSVVNGEIGCGGYPVVIPFAAIERVALAEPARPHGFDTAAPVRECELASVASYAPGDAAEVIGGPFDGVVVIDAADAAIRKRVRVILPLFGVEREIDINLDNLRLR